LYSSHIYLSCRRVRRVLSTSDEDNDEPEESQSNSPQPERPKKEKKNKKSSKPKIVIALINQISPFHLPSILPFLL